MENVGILSDCWNNCSFLVYFTLKYYHLLVPYLWSDEIWNDRHRCKNIIHTKRVVRLPKLLILTRWSINNQEHYGKLWVSRKIVHLLAEWYCFVCSETNKIAFMTVIGGRRQEGVIKLIVELTNRNSNNIPDLPGTLPCQV